MAVAASALLRACSYTWLWFGGLGGAAWIAGVGIGSGETTGNWVRVFGEVQAVMEIARDIPSQDDWAIVKAALHR